jgi:hypothetical protein
MELRSSESSRGQRSATARRSLRRTSQTLGLAFTLFRILRPASRRQMKPGERPPASLPNDGRVL